MAAVVPTRSRARPRTAAITTTAISVAVADVVRTESRCCKKFAVAQKQRYKNVTMTVGTMAGTTALPVKKGKKKVDLDLDLK